ncbi:ran-binding protein 3-like isoform X1 [Daktulosphaira vitifoliae]|uniref:ran-binding protein 3-like isoform X1 n=1 Tax=Daktulosphaira vitifoliae TaxID=58002 RepID=UPI0021AAAE93|nr:ran-binding protein 3-like isoform X1 [Daktulosphaira vitifoliae]
MTEQVEVNENPVSNDHESPQVIKPSNSLQEYQIESLETQASSPMFLRPSLLPSSSSFRFDLNLKKPDTPRPSKTFSLNPSRLSLNSSISNSKPSSAANISIQKDPDNNSVLALSKNEVSLQSPPAVFGAVIQKSRTQKPDKVSLVSDFVFGQNLHERVELNKEVDSTSEDDKKTNKTQEAEVSSSSNIVSPTFENLKNEEHGENGKLDESAEDSKRRLIEAAKEYEESRATKRKYDEVDCMTGEENDMNVFQLNLCKLYMYDNAKSNWVEKGRGQLRVNDMDNGKSSRVVMRNNGNLKVILNTKIWSDMKVEKVNEKNVRLTAFEEDSIKVFLILGPVKSMNEFINILQVRIARHKEANKMNSNLEIDDKKVVQLNEEEGTLL